MQRFSKNKLKFHSSYKKATLARSHSANSNYFPKTLTNIYEQNIVVKRAADRRKAKRRKKNRKNTSFQHFNITIRERIYIRVKISTCFCATMCVVNAFLSSSPEKRTFSQFFSAADVVCCLAIAKRFELFEKENKKEQTCKIVNVK